MTRTQDETVKPADMFGWKQEILVLALDFEHARQYEPRGLFGKLTGRYWIPQHARGSVDHGVIEQHVTVHPDE